MYRTLLILLTLYLSTLVSAGKDPSKAQIKDSKPEKGNINTKCHGIYINGEKPAIAGEGVQRPVNANGERLPMGVRPPSTPQSVWATCDRRIGGSRTSKLDLNQCLGWNPTTEELIPQSRGNGITKGGCSSCFYAKPHLKCVCGVRNKQDDRISVQLDNVVEATHDGFLTCFEHTGSQVSMDQMAIS
ncbi:hypothetical protein F9C07_2287096 [Aspergillus flavus]|uniref:Cyanovirin-N domain-containing protein n=2 Tax=Aspergillus subgen. Circumdati TaxID=2720871 RepID=A0A7G5KL27_ASPFN|nr:uncharacterized protein G4B84_012043 [Aspergillus flavus NRRL3357]EIT75458.1 hypothetical protein Ao3042_08465 [Aspergillus oryzae 3.042]KDE81917.1 hypothetical protein AO1008_08336 [Aspergillus oryzae 100-8]QMW48569.1 hypothetical protein G4B11_012087 [Aspergillus flavus]KAF7626437.1 hypothetical protein AFLA_013829 [Aspergillus flavus NRRL3357]QMW36514.1 hypothetical protein G4B84_012043 [Aspergillus flavus NRRL3357]|eukprot:EIT75458.1 hypothetical protein Ao3042_08465 [Aspergillus oryzae 3.042]